MEPVSGKLEYLGWDRPWMVGERDVSRLFWETAACLKDRLATQTYSRDGYALTADPLAGMKLEHEGRGSRPGLFKEDGSFGFTNVAAYLEMALWRLNGRTVNVMCAPEAVFSIEAAAFEQVPEVRYYDGNMSRGSPDAGPNDEFVRRVCKPSTVDCCIFLTAGADGFACAKFSGWLTQSLLDRKAEGTLRATRIGNCRNIGREGME